MDSCVDRSTAISTRVRLFRLFLLIPCWESQRLIPKRSAGPRATKIGVVSLKALDHHRPNREDRTLGDARPRRHVLDARRRKTLLAELVERRLEDRRAARCGLFGAQRLGRGAFAGRAGRSPVIAGPSGSRRPPAAIASPWRRRGRSVPGRREACRRHRSRRPNRHTRERHGAEAT